MLWYQTDLDCIIITTYRQTVAVMTQYYVISVWTKSMESFQGTQ